jgi:thioredoxin-related protein
MGNRLIKYKILILILNASLLCAAQDTAGIKFESGLNWQQVIEKAKAENKYIFVDCYATWCKPCKQMDKMIYPNNAVGKYTNERFVSLKLQMDSTSKDNDFIKKLYPAAREFEKQYSIQILPTYLFFSSDGTVVHKSTGTKTVSEFLTVLKESTQPENQLYTIIKNWKSGAMDLKTFPFVINKIKSFGEDSLSNQMAKDYIQNFLNFQNDSVFYQKSTLDFLRANSKSISSKDRIFQLWYYEANRMDSIVNQTGYSKQQVYYTVYNEGVLPFLINAEKTSSTPSWKRIRKTIKVQYNGELANYCVLNGKIRWYKKKKIWDEYLFSIMAYWKLYSKQFAKLGWFYLNEIAWDACAHTNDKKILRAALQWSEIAISLDQSSLEMTLDTKANILYKLGHRDEAIETEKKALDLFEQKHGTDSEYSKGLMVYYRKMIADMEQNESIHLKE